MDYKIIFSNRRTIAIEITENCEIIVRAPRFLSKREIEKFVLQKQKWIEKTLVKQELKRKNKKVFSEDEIRDLYKFGEEFLKENLPKWAEKIGVEPTGVKITSAKKRFGSCSPKNSLCFSVYLFSYPESAIEYVIVHELCHIKYHNHSKKFWQEVKKHLPDYKQREKLLKI
ncbi:MAG: M48 family metallopeptidase [Clostridia bacterium]|nr:M48 family metallopeptidase [Clostridia bacterium]